MFQETENGRVAQTVRPKEVLHCQEGVSRAKLERWFRVFREQSSLEDTQLLCLIQSVCCLFCRRNESQDLVNN